MSGILIPVSSSQREWRHKRPCLISGLAPAMIRHHYVVMISVVMHDAAIFPANRPIYASTPPCVLWSEDPGMIDTATPCSAFYGLSAYGNPPTLFCYPLPAQKDIPRRCCPTPDPSFHACTRCVCVCTCAQKSNMCRVTSCCVCMTAQRMSDSDYGANSQI